MILNMILFIGDEFPFRRMNVLAYSSAPLIDVQHFDRPKKLTALSIPRARVPSGEIINSIKSCRTYKFQVSNQKLSD
jgi:hypothetical protein